MKGITTLQIGYKPDLHSTYLTEKKIIFCDIKTHKLSKQQSRTRKKPSNKPKRFLQNYYYLNCDMHSAIVSLNALYLTPTCILVYRGVKLQSLINLQLQSP